MRRLAPVLLALLAAGCSAGPEGTIPSAQAPAEGRASLRLAPLLEGFDEPLLALADGQAGGALLVVEQGGRIWRASAAGRELVLDASALTAAGGERGLLGFAPGPANESPRRAYVSYTDLQGDSVLARYRFAGDVLDPGSAEILLTVDQPYGNHNGGHILFGPDGHLHYGLGDGGSSGDPQGNGQDRHALLGSLLRLDVTPAQGYAIPPDNPYADGREGAPEVYAKGLRNPWRFSFDPANADLWIADVGQNRVEEVNVVPAGTGLGANFGWNAYEGSTRYERGTEPYSEPVAPVAEYGHDQGCSVTGGHVYRGPGIPALEGAYVFGDYCSGRVWALSRGEGDGWRLETLLETGLRISSFGLDAQGEILVVDHGGAIHRIEAS